MKPILKITFFLFCIAFVILLLFYSAGILFAPNFLQTLYGEVCFKSDCFSVELAKTDAEKERGLMFKNHLDEDGGMLFIFDREGIYSIWMKNTLIPLDIIWIDKDRKIVFINKNSQPCGASDCPAVNPGVKAKYVLEINAGISEKTGLAIGDEAELKIEN